MYFNRETIICLGSLQSVTSSFGDKSDVVPKHWKTHVVEERLDISSELDCAGLAQLEQWHYSVFDSSGTCYLAMISTESESVLVGNNQEININLNLLSDFKTETYATRTSNLYTFFIYQSFTNTKNTEHCSVHCYFDANDNCDFHFLHNDHCYLGNFNTESAIGTTSGSHTMFIFKGEKLIYVS